MDYDKIYAVTDRLQPTKPQEISAAEAATGVRFPPGYAEYVERFGTGVLSNWVRVYPPDRIALEHAGQRERREEYFFWTEDLLTREQVIGSILLADTLNGDEVIYHHREPRGLFVLPQYEETIVPIGESLPDALDWLCTSGELTAPLSFLSFEPEAGREQRRYEAAENGPTYDAARDALLALGLHDHAKDATEGDDKCFDLFVREFGGCVTIVAGSNGALVGIRSDESAAGEKLNRVLRALRKLGLEESPQ